MVRQSISIQQRLMLLFGGTFTVIVVLVGATIYMTGRSAARSVAIERLTHVSEE
jgi:ABC-type branched-subunit amino acid transport system permease subunit